MPPPMPLFIDVDTGCAAEYMTANGLGLRRSPESSHRPCWCAKAPVAGMRREAVMRPPSGGLEGNGQRREEVACKDGRELKSRSFLDPFFPGTTW